MGGEVFKELGPIFAGCLLPLFLGAFLQRGWSRRVKFLVTLVVSALVGALATLLSGEFRVSWAFVLLDMAEVFVAAQVVYFGLYRPLRRRTARHGQPLPEAIERV